jgi:hypothetical protein
MPTCPEPQHPILADLLCRLDECQREAYEERAGILTFEAGVDRPLAEALAMLDLIRLQPMALSGITVLQIELDGGSEWLVSTHLTYARRYVSDVGGNEIAVRQLADVLLTQYGGIALLTTLG